VIQNDINNEFSETTVIAMMTAHNFGLLYPTHVEVSADETGLRDPSTILLEQVQTVSIERLGQRIGHVPPHVMEEIDRALHYSLGLSSCPITRSSG
jgi:mRNA interferase MazF